ncbi:MAG: methylated-DNA--[protein]-cysteine S-methyltransferase [Acidobacteriota bacterium]
MILRTARIESPVGTLTLLSSDAGLCALSFDDEDAALERCLGRFPGADVRRDADPAGAVRALAAYFAGDLAAIDRIPVDLGGTPFQASVWRELRCIPAGATRSYRDLAIAIGRPSATRAVGLANGQNPVAIVVPCHRVIGADGRLVGYGGGIPRKRWLLSHEGARPERDREPALFPEYAAAAR